MVFCGLYYIESQINQLNSLSAWKWNPGPSEIIGNFVLIFSPAAFSAHAQTMDLFIVFNYLFLYSFCVISRLRIQNVCQKRPLSVITKERKGPGRRLSGTSSLNHKVDLHGLKICICWVTKSVWSKLHFCLQRASYTLNLSGVSAI